MNTQIKNALAVVAVLFLVVIAGSAISYVRTYDRQAQPGNFRSFSVTGEGKVVAVPDVAQFTFTVITEGGNDVASLQEQNAEKTNAAIAYLKGEGVEDEDVKTQNYNVQPRYQYSSCREGGICPPPEIVGYSINQSVQVKVREFTRAGELLSGVVKAGANSVSQLNFTIDDPTSLESDARALAIMQAKEKAEAIAEAGDFKVGRILSIGEYNDGPQPMPYAYGLGAGGYAEDSVAKNVVAEPGSQEVNVNVTVTYEIR